MSGGSYWLVCFMKTARSKEFQKIIFLAGSIPNSKIDTEDRYIQLLPCWVFFLSNADDETSVFHGAYSWWHNNRSDEKSRKKGSEKRKTKRWRQQNIDWRRIKRWKWGEKRENKNEKWMFTHSHVCTHSHMFTYTNRNWHYQDLKAWRQLEEPVVHKCYIPSDFSLLPLPEDRNPSLQFNQRLPSVKWNSSALSIK